LNALARHLSPDRQPPATAVATVVEISAERGLKKCEPGTEGNFVLVKLSWAKKNAPVVFGPVVFGLPALRLAQRAGNAGIELERKTYVLTRTPDKLWIARRHVLEMTEEQLQRVSKGSMFYATVDDNGTNLTPRRKDDPEASLFLDASYLVSSFRVLEGVVNAIVAPDEVQPRIPFYFMGEDRVVTPLSLRRLCEDERIKGVLQSVYKVEDDSEACGDVFKVHYASYTNGRFVPIKKSNGSSVPVILLQDVLAHDTFSNYRHFVGQGSSILPVAQGNHPKNTGVGARSSKSGGRSVTTSVKCTIGSRLIDSSIRDLLTYLVEYVTNVSSFGCFMMNLHYTRLLKENEGSLPDTAGSFTDVFVRQAMHFARIDNQPDVPTLRETYAKFEEQLSGLQVPSEPGLCSAALPEAQAFITSTYNSIQAHGPGRLAYLIKSACVLEGSLEKGTVYKIVKSIENGKDFVGSSELSEGLRMLIEKYRRLYVEKGVDGKFGFAINDVHALSQQAKLKSVLEIYWHISEDLEALETRALDSGWSLTVFKDVSVNSDEHGDLIDEHGVRLQDRENVKKKIWKRFSFHLLPLNNFGLRFVRIERDSWSKFLRKELDMDIEGLDAEDMFSILKIGGKHRQDVRTLRSKSAGYRPATTFRTDGTSVVLGFTRTKKKSKQGKSGMVIPTAKDRVVGLDPGRVNLMVTATRGSSTEDYKFDELSRKTYYELSGSNARKRVQEQRKLTHSRLAHEELSKTRKNTLDPDEFAKYVSVVAKYKAEFAKTYRGRNARGEKFKAYREKTKVLDGFIAGLGSHADVSGDGRLIIGYGDGSFASTGKGEKAVPTSAQYKRMQTAFKERFLMCDVSETNTTKCCCKCYQELESCYREKMVDGEVKKYQDRDVKRCNSPQCLESHPCFATEEEKTGLTERSRRPGGVLINRDKNSAVSMHTLTGVPEEERPVEFQKNNNNHVPFEEQRHVERLEAEIEG
jgi:hypothetical protein